MSTQGSCQTPHLPDLPSHLTRKSRGNFITQTRHGAFVSRYPHSRTHPHPLVAFLLCHLAPHPAPADEVAAAAAAAAATRSTSAAGPGVRLRRRIRPGHVVHLELVEAVTLADPAAPTIGLQR